MQGEILGGSALRRGGLRSVSEQAHGRATLGGLADGNTARSVDTDMCSGVGRLPQLGRYNGGMCAYAYDLSQRGSPRLSMDLRCAVPDVGSMSRRMQ